MGIDAAMNAIIEQEHSKNSKKKRKTALAVAAQKPTAAKEHLAALGGDTEPDLIKVLQEKADPRKEPDLRDAVDQAFGALRSRLGEGKKEAKEPEKLNGRSGPMPWKPLTKKEDIGAPEQEKKKEPEPLMTTATQREMGWYPLED